MGRVSFLTATGVCTFALHKNLFFCLARSRSYWRTLFCKVLPDFRRNLTIGHLVNCFNADDAPTQFVSLETFLQLALGLTRPKY